MIDQLRQALLATLVSMADTLDIIGESGEVLVSFRMKDFASDHVKAEAEIKASGRPVSFCMRAADGHDVCQELPAFVSGSLVFDQKQFVAGGTASLRLIVENYSTEDQL